MKPITGSVVSSKPVSLSKASSILSRFVTSETGAHQDVSAFLRRTAEAFDELVKFHQDLGTQRELELSSFKGGNEGDGRRRKKKKKKREVAVVETALVHIVAEGNPGPISGLFQHGGDLGFLDLKDKKSGSREEKKKRKKRVDKEVYGGVSNAVEIGGEKRESGEDRRKKIDDVEEGRQMEGNVENHSARRRKEKRKQEEDVREGRGDAVENHVQRHHKKKRKVKEES